MFHVLFNNCAYPPPSFVLACFSSSENDYCIPLGVKSVPHCQPTSGCLRKNDHNSNPKHWGYEVSGNITFLNLYMGLFLCTHMDTRRIQTNKNNIKHINLLLCHLFRDCTNAGHSLDQIEAQYWAWFAPWRQLEGCSSILSSVINSYLSKAQCEVSERLFSCSRSSGGLPNLQP